MTKFKKVIAMMLALLMAFSSMSAMAMAWDTDELVDPELSIRTEFLKEVDGNWVTTEKVVPGQAVKARIYVGTNYYSNDSDLLFHYDDSFFDVIFEDGEVYDLAGVNTEAGVTAQIMNDAVEKTLGVLVKLDSEYNALYDSNVWLFDIPLTVKSTASGRGRIYVDKSDVRNTDNQGGYINFPAGPEDGSSENYNDVVGMEHWDIDTDSIILDNPYVSIETSLVFHANGGAFKTGDAETFEATGDIGAALTGVPEIEKEGYAFRGWTAEANVLPYSATPAVYPENDAEYYAYWDKTVDLVFNAGEGRFEGDKAVETYSNLVPGEDFTAPANPVRAGYTFTGWDKAVPDKVPYAVSASDYTVAYTATWAENVTLNFYMNEGDANALYTFDGYAGKTFSETVTEPTKAGFYFAGWSPEMPEVFPNENTDYVAQWEDRTYTVNYYVDGEFRASAQVAYNADVNLDYPAAQADYGYQLAEWHLNSANGDVITAGYKMPDHNINVYNTQSVLTDLDAVFKLEAEDAEAYATLKFDFDEQITAPEAPTKAGYKFLGWNPELGIMDNANGKTFVAVWEPEEINVTFYAYNTEGTYEEYQTYDIEKGKTLDVPADPYMAGYTFTGWATAEGQTTGASAREIAEIVMGAGELSFYEARTANVYKVNFDANGGTAVATPQNVAFGNNIVLPATTRAGYDFLGWKDEGGVDRTANYPVPALGENGAEMTLTAQWGIKKYTITLKDDAADIDTITADYGTVIARPADPEKEGYYFTGWDNLPERMPAENVTVNSQWGKEQYTYSFNSNGGSAVPAITAEYGDAIAAPTAPVRAGYTFAGWFAEGAETEYTFTASMPDLGDNGAVVVLKAKWNNAPLTLTFDANGGSFEGGSTTSSVLVSYNAAISAPVAAPVRNGFNLAYWFEDGNENTPFIFDKMPARDVVLKAKWNNNAETAYKVIIYTMDTAGDYVANETFRAGQTNAIITFEDIKPTLGEGFEFSSANLSDSEKLIAADGSMVFEIYVDRCSYDLTVKVDGNETTQQVYFDALLPQLEAPEKTGYKLDYWYNEATGDSFDLANDTMPAGALTLVAKLSAKNYDANNGVKFNANGGAFADSSTVKTVAATFGAAINAPAAPSRNGYEFKGWAELANSDEAVELPALAVDLDDESLTYYAVWEAESYANAVMFDANGGEFEGGELVKAVSATFGRDIDLPEDPTKYGYSFIGWASTKTASAAEEISALSVDLSSTSLTYFAVWEAESYTNAVMFDANGGKFVNGKNIVPANNATFGEEIVVPFAPTKAGYKFAGWMETADSEEILVAPGANIPALNVDLSDATITYYAKWVNANDTAYTVTVYTMGIDGKYDKGTSTVLTGTTGAEVRFDDVKPALGEGFTFGSHDVEKTITADGKMVFGIYVDRVESQLSFVVDGAGYGSARDLLFGAEIAEPSMPSKSGYTFDYWYANDEAVAFDFATRMPANDLTLTAKFSVKSFSAENGVKFNANGGAFSDLTTEISVAATFGQPINAPAAPSRTGYTFMGWSEGSHAGATVIEIPALSVDLENTPLTYYAVWSPKTYSGVKFNANEGAFADSSIEKTLPATFGQPVSAPNEAPIRAGYTFAGWAASASPTAPLLAVPGAKLPALDKDLDVEALTYYAKWMSNGDTAFKVAVYEMNADGNYEGVEPKIIERSGNSGATVTYAQEASFIVIPDGFEADPVASDNQIVINGNGSSVMKIYLKRSTYIASFVDGNGATSTVSALYGAAIAAPAGTDMSGREFIGWADENGFAPSTMPIGGVTFTAIYESKTYTVNFNINGKIASAQIVYGETVNFNYPEIAAPYGYEIVGWHIGSETGALVEEAITMPADNLELFAALAAKKANAVFKLEADDTEAYYTVEVDFDAKITAPAAPTKAGYDFVCWNPEVGIMDNEEGKTFVAVWEPSSVNVAYYAYNAEGGYELYQSYEIQNGKKIDVPADPYMAGYTFRGWATTEGQTSGASSAELSAIVMNNSELRYFEARTINNYNVTFDTNGGTQVETPKTYEFNETVTLPVTTKEGYSFTGWKAEDGTVYNSSFVMSAIGEDGATLALTAQWSINSYEISFDVDNGTAVETPQTLEFNADIVLPATTREGYTFAGWYEGNSEFALTKMPARDVALKAKWNINSYEISFDVDNGTAVETPQTLEFNADIVLPTTTREGYTFAGWYEGESAFALTKMPARAVALKAKWNINSYEISFDVDNGSAVDTPKTLEFNADIVLPTTTREGYTFGGWYEGESAFTLTKMPARAVALKAKWNVNSYEISFDVDNGTAVETPQTLDFGADIVLPTTTREGYTFGGWYEGEAAFTLTKMPARAVALKAKWNIDDYTITFDANGGKLAGDKITEAVTTTFGEEIAVPTAPTREGYTFGGWYEIDENTLYNDFSAMPAREFTLKAKWDINDYTITFDANGGMFAGDKATEAVTTTFGEEIAVPAAPEREGYTFAYWYETDENTRYNDFSAMPAREFTLKAKWNNNDDTPYKVIIHRMNTAGVYVAEESVLAGETGSTITFAMVKPTLEAGFEFSTVMASDTEKTITADGEMTFNIYVDRRSYDLTVKVDGNETTHKVYFGAMLPQLETPTKYGHSFANWYKVEGVPFILSNETMPAEDLTITADFLPETYVDGVIFNANEGKFAGELTEKPATATFGAAFNAPEEPTREGYEFKGWAETADAAEEDMVTAAGENLPALAVDLDDESLTYFAVWAIKDYTITFNANSGKFEGDKATEAVTTTFGEEIVVPTAPTREGYTFAYWYESDVNTPYNDFSAMPARSFTLRAKWNANPYTITFDADGGMFAGDKATEAVTTIFGEEIVVPTAPEREGHTFAYWYETDENISYDDFSAMPAREFTLKAKWNVNSYEISFDVDNGTAVVTPQTLNFGADIVLPTTTREGYTFAGWYEGESEFVLTKMPARAVALKAKWNANPYTITFDADGGKFAGDKATEAVTTTFDEEIVVPTAPTREGHTFGGWYEIDENTLYNDFSAMPAREFTLKAKWNINSYEISFDVDNGTAVVTPQTLNFDADIVLPTTTREGYTFAGWYEGESEFVLTKMPARAVALKAKWNVNSYEISFDVDNGTAVETPQTLDFGADIVLPTTTREGYTFAGWYEGEAEFTLTKMPARAVALKATWNANPYTITFDADGGKLAGDKATEAVTTIFGNEINVPAAPEREGYTFAYWYETDENISYDDFSAMPARSFTLKAKWNANPYTITFDANGGKFGESELPKEVTTLFGNEIDVPDAPEKQGYIFGGWYETNENILYNDFSAMPARNFTLRAKWNNATGVEYRYVVYTMNTAGDDFVPGTPVVCYGTTGEIITLEMINYEPEAGFKLSTVRASDTEKAITADGEMIFEIYIDRIEYQFIAQEEDGTVIKQDPVLYGAMLPQLETPVKYGYSFDYWYRVEGVPFILSNETMPAENLTIIAKFLPETYDNKVIFDANEGKFEGDKETEAVTATFGAAFDAPEEPTREGYEFKGWAETADATEEDIIATLPALSVDLDSESLTYYAVWKAESYANAVIFDANGGEFEGGEPVKAVSATFNQQINAPDAPTREGFEFIGWAESEDPNASVVSISKLSVDLSDATITYYAKWSATGDTAYTVVVHKMGVDGIYVEDSRLPRTGDCDSLVNYAETISGVVVPEGFEADEEKSDAPKAITADGEMEFNIYIARKSYNAIFTDGEDFEETVPTLYGAAIVAPAAPEKEGKRFNRWIDVNGNEPSTMPIGGASFIAEYENSSCTVRYFVGGELVGSFPVEYGSVIPTVCATYTPTEGYDFNGIWYTDIDCTIPLDAEATITSNIVELYGKEAPHAYTITFDADGGKFENGEGTYVTTATVEDSAYNVPEAPTKEGFSFGYWSPDIGKLVEPEDKVYTAVWNSKEYNVYYKWLEDETNPELGYVDYEVIPIYYAEKLEAPADPFKPGYDFLGWSTVAGATTDLLDSTDICSLDMEENSVVFFAVFAASTSVVTYNIYEMDEFGVYPEVPDSYTESDVAFGTVLSSSDYAVPNGFTLDTENSTDSVTVDETTEVMNIYLSRNKYRVNYYLDESDETPVDYQEFYYDASISYFSIEKGRELVNASEDDAVKYGKEFHDWDYDPMITKMPITDEVRVNAILHDKEFVVYFVKRLADDSEPEPVVFYYGDEVEADLDYEEEPGYDFIGWVDSESKAVTLPFTVGNDTPAEQTLYAVHSKKMVEVNFYIHEKAKEPYKTVTLPFETDLVNYVPDIADLYEGHWFIGWMPEPISVDESDVMDFYGEWEDEYYSIEFDENGGTLIENPEDYVDIIFGSEVIIPVTTKAGATFVGWEAEDGTVYSTDFEMPDIGEDGDVLKLTAKWTTNPTSTITFDSNGGTEVSAITAEVNADIVLPTTTREGYTFAGWYEGESEFTLTKMPARAVALKAKWNINQYEYKFMVDGDAEPFASGMADYDSAISSVVPTGAPTAPEGMRFAGWSKDGSTVVTDFGKISSVEADNIFLAVFEEDAGSTTVSVTFYEYDGSNEHGPATRETDKDAPVYDCSKIYETQNDVESGTALVLPTAPELANYTFAGWFDASGKEWTAGESVPASGLELYAKYARVQCGLVAREGSTTVIERGSTSNLNNLDDVASYTEESVWFVYGLTDLLLEATLLNEYITCVGDCRIVVARKRTFVGTDTIITVIDNVSGDTVEKFHVIIYGDLNGDGYVNANDVSLCRNEALGSTDWSSTFSDKYDSIRYKAANVDGRMFIQTNDTSIIKAKSLGSGDINQVTGRKA